MDSIIRLVFLEKSGKIGGANRYGARPVPATDYPDWSKSIRAPRRRRRAIRRGFSNRTSAAVVKWNTCNIWAPEIAK
ncbi:MAG: hypothetical protein H7327_09640 [Herminiimonas sp.]|nr:hypothetical protein [Herminiimonas sp.]